MKKVELEIIALSSSVSKSPNYAVILGEVNGNRRLPIVIGTFEAQAIVVSLEQLKIIRPLTHDLFFNFILTFEIEVTEVLIYKFEDSIFYAKLICIKDGEIIEIDARTSDSLALAVRIGCPIYIYGNILDTASVIMDSLESGEAISEPEAIGTSQENDNDKNKLKSLSLSELEQLLQEILDQEDYAYAIVIRDEINQRKNKN